MSGEVQFPDRNYRLRYNLYNFVLQAYRGYD